MRLRPTFPDPRPRVWRTGALAVVMAALSGAACAQPAMRVLASRHDVARTAALLEASARRHGMALFASVTAGDGVVLVLESSAGGTPVVVPGDGQALNAAELPLRIELRALGDGASEVRIPMPAPQSLPDELAGDVAQLPELVAEALAG